MLRGAAALVVVAEHARAFIFIPHGELSGLHPAWTGFYAATTFGHQAVMIFFALSGFLVGGRVIEDFRTGTWSWPKYALRRLTRLWIVVLPALLLTLLFDKLGLAFGYAEGYEGLAGNLYASLPADGSGTEHSIPVFIGNAAFLQTIYVPIYGSNGPLWSLAYEFWYYVMAPLVLSLVFFVRRPLLLTMNICILGGVVWFLPEAVLWGGVIWLAGAATRVLMPSLARFILPHASLLALFSIIVIFFMTLISEINLFAAADIILGCVVAAALPVLALAPVHSRTYRRIAESLAEISYTLYATHFPILMAATMIFLAPTRLEPSVQAVLVYILFLLISLLSAVFLWACFERHTGRVYLILSNRITVAS